MSNATPLSERVPVPAALPVPSHRDVREWRAATTDDIDAILATQRLMDAVDHPSWTTPRSEIAEDFESTHIDPTTDSLIALSADGTVLAWGITSLGPGQETRVQSYVLGGVHPEWRGRGIGRELMAWQVARSRQQLASSGKALPGWTVSYQEESNTTAVALAGRLGMRLERYFTSMERRISEPIPDIELPDGVSVVPFSEDLAEMTLLARNDAFRDHWGSQPTLAERWRQFTEGEEFRADLSWVAVEDQPDGARRVIALALSTVNEDDWGVQGFSSGYVALIGVVRDRRGRRLAPACISVLLRSYASAGLERAILDVDTESPTGAHSLYTGMGFVATTRSVALVIEY
ncbi:mycothiol synthase [Labedella gwakjiensis]|uniref:GNAT family N-acetyltransferase n=1 Tax=Labedella gwakjiensis TaxID=390269 RepID=A0A2P8GRY7_9MICO|nr:GNAT family N-acetyltransferase [Labedella gwakjiensis]PSL36714.1 mycothiol synthase [Labedella gwakjiensis]RUQ84229.1 GNAT family N-acetyltransferase [Labedella gwakjiensis]